MLGLLVRQLRAPVSLLFPHPRTAGLLEKLAQRHEPCYCMIRRGSADRHTGRWRRRRARRPWRRAGRPYVVLLAPRVRFARDGRACAHGRSAASTSHLCSLVLGRTRTEHGIALRGRITHGIDLALLRRVWAAVAPPLCTPFLALLHCGLRAAVRWAVGLLLLLRGECAHIREHVHQGVVRRRRGCGCGVHCARCGTMGKGGCGGVDRDRTRRRSPLDSAAGTLSSVTSLTRGCREDVSPFIAGVPCYVQGYIVDSRSPPSVRLARFGSFRHRGSSFMEWHASMGA